MTIVDRGRRAPGGFAALAVIAIEVAAAQASEVRFATFNASLNRGAAGELIADLSSPDDAQARAAAEIIQRVGPDVLLINEFDFDAGGAALDLFLENYLAVSQNGAAALDFPYVFQAPSNTGLASGFDLNNDGQIVLDPNTPGYGDDALGFGNFAGQFGFVLLSKFPIDEAGIRTFQRFRWQDMPGALLPVDPVTGEPWYAPEELELFRLSSKNHVDVPIEIDGGTVHVLASHPTPPTFDGAEDRNGRRNHDEIRFWADYVYPRKSGYVVDDAGNSGGLDWGSSFVIMGDQNADPADGDSVANAIRQLLDLRLVDTEPAPSSAGGAEAALLQGGANQTHDGDPALDTADFGDDPARFGPGNLRVDYVLPSRDLEVVAAQVFWPTADDPSSALVSASDHRLVWVDVVVGE
jgi:hypothetical protein